MNCPRLTIILVVLILAAGLLHAENGSPTDSLINLINSGVARDDAARYDILCDILSGTEDVETLLKYSDQALKLAEKLDKSPVVAIVFKGKGYLNSGQLASALELFIQAANLYKTENHNKGLAMVYMYMSEAYNQLENFNNAKTYIRNAIQIYQAEKDTTLLATALLNLGYLNYSNDQNDTALVFLSRASQLFQKLDNRIGYGYCLGNAGLAYSKLTDLGKAEDYLLQAMEILTREGDEFAVTEYRIAYAGILQQKGDIEKALTVANGSFDWAIQNDNKVYVRDAALCLAGLYKVTGRYDSACQYMETYIQAKDSIKSEDNIKKMADMRTAFEVAKKQAEVDGLEKKKLIQLIVILGLVLILALSIGLGGMYYYSLKKSKRLTAELDERRNLLEKQGLTLQAHQEELLSQKEELQATLDNLKKTQEQLIESEKMAAIGGLVAGVAHEINTPIGIGITAISSLQDDIHRIAGMYEKEEINREDFKEFIMTSEDVSGLIKKNLERTASIIQSFKQLSADQASEQMRMFGFKDYLNDILISLRPKFREKKIDFRIECDEELQLNSYPGVYAQIFTNLLINSLDHGFHKRNGGSIGIRVEFNANRMKILYSDDGVGISGKDLPHIFEPFYTTDQQRGTGLGLNIIYSLVRQKLQGTITCESQPGKGVLFVMEVPVRF
jgi:signal transduction histidine kinase